MNFRLKIIALDENKELVFVYPDKLDSFVELFEKNKGYIVKRIEEKLGKFLFKRAYIILDGWVKSEAIRYAYNKNLGYVLLNIYNADKTLRDNETLMFFLIHELCHLTEKGNYPYNKTPEDIHKSFDILAKEIVRELFK